MFEYKYVLLDHSGHHAIAWQQGNNSVLALRSADEFVEVFDNWCARARVLGPLVLPPWSLCRRLARLLSLCLFACLPARRGGDPGAKVVADGAKPVTRENRLLSWATEVEAQLVAQRQELRRSRVELMAAQEVGAAAAAREWGALPRVPGPPPSLPALPACLPACLNPRACSLGRRWERRRCAPRGRRRGAPRPSWLSQRRRG